MKQKFKKKIPFSQVSNKVLNDKKLSLKAKGLFAYLYSKPDDWQWSGKRIKNDNTDGQRSVYSGLKELEDKGYLQRRKMQDGRSEYFISYIPKSTKPKSTKPQLAKTETISKKELIQRKSIGQSKDCTHEIHYKDVIDTHDRPNIPRGKTPRQNTFMGANKLGWHYKKEVKRLHGVDPIFNKSSGGKQITIAKNAIKQIGLEKAKQHCTAYLQDKDSSEFNIDFSTVFSTAMINKFLPKLNNINKVRF